MLLSFENTRSTHLALPTRNTAYDVWSYSHKTRYRPAEINLDGLSAKFAVEVGPTCRSRSLSCLCSRRCGETRLTRHAELPGDLSAELSFSPAISNIAARLFPIEYLRTERRSDFA